MKTKGLVTLHRKNNDSYCLYIKNIKQKEAK